MTEQDEKFNRKGTVISSQTAHIANHFLQACIAGAQRQGYSVNDIFASAEVPIELLNQPEQLITEQQLTRLIQAVWKYTKDEFMCLATTPCNSGIFSLMAEYCLHSQTLGAMLKRSARFYSAVYQGLDIQLEQPDTDDNDLVFFKLTLTNNDLDKDHLIQEFLLLMWQRLGCWMVDQQIPIALTTFNYSPPQHVKEYRAMYSGELKFNQDFCGFYIHSRYLNLPIVKDEEQLRIFLKESPAYVLHRPSQDFRLQTKIRLILANYDYNQMPELAEIATQIHLTPRSISRKLKDEGTTFSAIKTSLRREYAIKLLTTEHLSINEVSQLVGFSETGSFCRAFKRWTGKAPSAWR